MIWYHESVANYSLQESCHQANSIFECYDLIPKKDFCPPPFFFFDDMVVMKKENTYNSLGVG